MAIHADNFLCTGYNDFTFISRPKDNSVAEKLETKCSKYLGLNMKHEDNIITLDKTNHANLMKSDININCRKKSILKLTRSKKEALKSKTD